MTQELQELTQTTETPKKVWVMPELEVLNVQETAGNGGAGFDFGSEMS